MDAALKVQILRSITSIRYTNTVLRIFRYSYHEEPLLYCQEYPSSGSCESGPYSVEVLKWDDHAKDKCNDPYETWKVLKGYCLWVLHLWKPDIMQTKTRQKKDQLKWDEPSLSQNWKSQMTRANLISQWHHHHERNLHKLGIPAAALADKLSHGKSADTGWWYMTGLWHVVEKRWDLVHLCLASTHLTMLHCKQLQWFYIKWLTNHVSFQTGKSSWDGRQTGRKQLTNLPHGQHSELLYSLHDPSTYGHWDPIRPA